MHIYICKGFGYIHGTVYWPGIHTAAREHMTYAHIHDVQYYKMAIEFIKQYI